MLLSLKHGIAFFAAWWMAGLEIGEFGVGN